MARELIIDDSFGCVRAALMEDGLLVEIHIEKQHAYDQAENLYYGRVQAVKPSLQAAFVDIGTQLHAFLPINDGVKLRCGDMIIVQGQAKQATESKGLRVTTNINLAGKWIVLLPDSSGVHISKKVKDPSLREELRLFGEKYCPCDCGLIVRTAGEEVTEQLLCDEIVSLHRLWQGILIKAKGMSKPGLLHTRLPLHMRLARDMQGLDAIIINSECGFDALCEAQMQHVVSAQTRIVRHSEERQLIFDAYGIENLIDRALKKRVWLPCGGYLVIDYCEAMTVIDVNSGKMVLGRDLEDTALRVNLEAAKEVARQLRLRNLSGVIVVDFIDMQQDEHRQQLLECMQKETAQDRAKVSIEGLTRLGLMEITRRREGEQLHRILRGSCSYCSGAGEILSADEVARRAMRQISRMMISGQRGPFLIRCGASAAQAFSGISAPEDEQIYISISHGKHAEKYDIEQIGAGMSLPSDAVALKKGLNHEKSQTH